MNITSIFEEVTNELRKMTSLTYFKSKCKALYRQNDINFRLSDVPGTESGRFTYIPRYQEKFVWNQYLLKGKIHLQSSSDTEKRLSGTIISSKVRFTYKHPQIPVQVSSQRYTYFIQTFWYLRYKEKLAWSLYLAGMLTLTLRKYVMIKRYDHFDFN